MTALKRQTVERLMRYYLCINEQCDRKEEATICSAHLANLINLDNTQVRKDLAAVGVKGYRHVGFKIDEILSHIENALGLNHQYNAVLIGSGRLGGAIAAYQGFAQFGLKITALFDIDPAKIGLVIGGHVVQPLEQLENIIEQKNVRMGVLTLPILAAQSIADRLVNAGIEALWNFSPVRLAVPSAVFVRNEHLTIGLAHLAHFMKNVNEQNAFVRMKHQPL